MSDNQETEAVRKILRDIRKLFEIAQLVESVDLDALIAAHEMNLPLVPVQHRADTEILIRWAKAIRTTLPALEDVKRRGNFNMRNVMNAGKN